MSHEQQPAYASGQISPDGQYLWNGQAWVPNPNLPKPKKKHTVRNVILGVLLVIILLMAGCMALFGAAVNEVDKAIKEGENQAGGSNNPITVEEGEGFTIGDTEWSSGWQLRQGPLGDAEVTGLEVTNNADTADFPDIEFRLFDGSQELTEISCGLFKEVQPGTTASIECIGDQRLPRSFDKITVQNSF